MARELTENARTPEDETYFTLESTLDLAPGQDFYAQPPFDDTILRISQETGLDPAIIKSAITNMSLAGGPSLDAKTIKERQDRVNQLRGRADLLYSYVSAGYRRQYKREEVVPAVKQTISTLMPYPRWSDYIRYNFAQPFYARDGGFAPKSSKAVFSPPPTYPAWLEQQHAKEQRYQNAAVAIVLLDTFPQQMQGQSLSDALGEGSGRIRRQWRIRSAMQ